MALYVLGGVIKTFSLIIFFQWLEKGLENGAFIH